MWSCGRCTLENPVRRHRCEACGARRPIVGDADTATEQRQQSSQDAVIAESATSIRRSDEPAKTTKRKQSNVVARWLQNRKRKRSSAPRGPANSLESSQPRVVSVRLKSTGQDWLALTALLPAPPPNNYADDCNGMQRMTEEKLLPQKETSKQTAVAQTSSVKEHEQIDTDDGEEVSSSLPAVQDVVVRAISSGGDHHEKRNDAASECSSRMEESSATETANEEDPGGSNGNDEKSSTITQKMFEEAFVVGAAAATMTRVHEESSARLKSSCASSSTVQHFSELTSPSSSQQKKDGETRSCNNRNVSSSSFQSSAGGAGGDESCLTTANNNNIQITLVENNSEQGRAIGGCDEEMKVVAAAAATVESSDPTPSACDASNNISATTVVANKQCTPRVHSPDGHGSSPSSYCLETATIPAESLTNNAHPSIANKGEQFADNARTSNMEERGSVQTTTTAPESLFGPNNENTSSSNNDHRLANEADGVQPINSQSLMEEMERDPVPNPAPASSPLPSTCKVDSGIQSDNPQFLTERATFATADSRHPSLDGSNRLFSETAAWQCFSPDAPNGSPPREADAHLFKSTKKNATAAERGSYDMQANEEEKISTELFTQTQNEKNSLDATPLCNPIDNVLMPEKPAPDKHVVMNHRQECDYQQGAAEAQWTRDSERKRPEIETPKPRYVPVASRNTGTSYSANQKVDRGYRFFYTPASSQESQTELSQTFQYGDELVHWQRHKSASPALPDVSTRQESSPLRKLERSNSKSCEKTQQSRSGLGGKPLDMTAFHPINDPTPGIGKTEAASVSFQTAGFGRAVTVSAASLAKANAILFGSSGDSPTLSQPAASHETQPGIKDAARASAAISASNLTEHCRTMSCLAAVEPAITFRTAGRGSLVTASADSVAKAANILGHCFGEDSDLRRQAEPSNYVDINRTTCPNPSSKPLAIAFQTAGLGTRISVSAESLAKAKSVFDANVDTATTVHNEVSREKAAYPSSVSVKECNVAMSPPSVAFANPNISFRTAGQGSVVSVSTESVEKAEAILRNLSDVDVEQAASGTCLHSTGSLTAKPGAVAFRTAGLGHKITVSAESVMKANKMLGLGSGDMERTDNFRALPRNATTSESIAAFRTAGRGSLVSATADSLAKAETILGNKCDTKFRAEHRKTDRSSPAGKTRSRRCYTVQSLWVVTNPQYAYCSFRDCRPW